MRQEEFICNKDLSMLEWKNFHLHLKTKQKISLKKITKAKEGRCPVGGCSSIPMNDLCKMDVAIPDKALASTLKPIFYMQCICI